MVWTTPEAHLLRVGRLPQRMPSARPDGTTALHRQKGGPGSFNCIPITRNLAFDDIAMRMEMSVLTVRNIIHEASERRNLKAR